MVFRLRCPNRIWMVRRSVPDSSRWVAKQCPRHVINTLNRLGIILWCGEEDIRHERLWVPIVQKKPTQLDLYHHSVSR